MQNVLGAMGVAVVLLSACSSSNDASPLDIADGAGGTAGSGGRVVAADSGTSAGGAKKTGGTTGSGGTRAAGGAPAGDASTGSGGTQFTDAGPVLTPGEWTYMNPWGATPSSCGGGAYCVAVDPSNPAVVYQCSCACNGECGIYKSTNAGSSWNHIGAIPSGYLDSAGSVRVDPQDPNHLYACDGVHGSAFGFWVSTDGGETFFMPEAFAEKANDSVGGWTSDVYHVDVDPADFNHVLLSFHSPFEFSVGGTKSGILETTDGGDSWIRHYPVATVEGAGWGIWFLHRPELGIGNASTWLLGAQFGGGHWRTTNAGASWTEVTANGMEHGGGQIYYASDGTLYSTGQPNMMKSTDNGATFSMVGPSAGYIGIIGDGSHLYAKAHDHSSPILTASESDGTAWSDYSPQPPEFFGGCYEYAFDRGDRIVYGAYLGAGLMAMKVP